MSGMVAALTPLPVIGVPVRASTLDGLDSLLSIVQVIKISRPVTITLGLVKSYSSIRFFTLVDRTLRIVPDVKKQV